MRQPRTKLWTNICLAFILGLALTLGAVKSIALADAPSDQPISLAAVPKPPFVPSAIYARVVTGSVPIYRSPLEAMQGYSPTRSLDAGYVWVTLDSSRPLQYADQEWYPINQDEYVRADYLEIYGPSSFHGLEVTTAQPFAFIVFDAWTAPEPGVAPGAESLLLKRYTVVPIQEAQTAGERTWYRVSEGHWLEQGFVGLVVPKPRPEGVGPQEKWIEVDLYEQTLAAYEGDQIVYATLVSSGLPWWPTAPGLFRIWLKTDQAKMSGREGYPDYYFLEDVPWTMYFNQNFALHGAYWHDGFGRPHSHGCVNLALADARWLFDWTSPAGRRGWSLSTAENPGTWVWVHE